MKIQIENLKAQMQGRDLNIHQKADALIEFNKLLDYVEELEQCNIANVVGQSEQYCDCDKPTLGDNVWTCGCGRSFKKKDK
jgi:hypothetical protein